MIDWNDAKTVGYVAGALSTAWVIPFFFINDEARWVKLAIVLIAAILELLVFVPIVEYVARKRFAKEGENE